MLINHNDSFIEILLIIFINAFFISLISIVINTHIMILPPYIVSILFLISTLRSINIHHNKHQQK
jgi:hypothetical protein